MLSDVAEAFLEAKAEDAELDASLAFVVAVDACVEAVEALDAALVSEVAALAAEVEASLALVVAIPAWVVAVVADAATAVASIILDILLDARSADTVDEVCAALTMYTLSSLSLNRSRTL